MIGDKYTKFSATGAVAAVGATLLKTGQQTSFRTGDDGDLEAGRATSFLVLASNNPFGNTNRFTDELGGSTYANNWVIDWSSYDGATVLGYYRLQNGLDLNWNSAIDQALGTFGTFSGCRLPNKKEFENIWRGDSTNGFNYAPFNLGTFLSFWTSTTLIASTTFSYQMVLANYGQLDYQLKTTATNMRFIPCRTFTVTGTTLS